MPTSLPNSKKCSTAETFGKSVLSGALALASTFAAIAPAHAVQASIRKPASVAPAVLAPQAPSTRDLLQQITASSRQASFEPLLRRWQILYGQSAVTPLLQVAALKSRPDPQRYVAVMGAARLGGRACAPKLLSFLRDSSWMLRTGALRALSALHDPSTSSAIVPLLHDPSLVVRLEAVEAAARLKPAGAAPALVQELTDNRNYQGGKALWLPGRALAALGALRASEQARALRPLLDHASDQDLLLETVSTLETLTGRTLKPGEPLTSRVQAWKIALAAR